MSDAIIGTGILLKAGDRMECSYDGAGTLKNPVVAPQAGR